MWGRVAVPNGSTPCQPTVQRPKENLSSLVGVGISMLIVVPLLWSGLVQYGGQASRRAAYASRTVGVGSASRVSVSGSGQSGSAPVSAHAAWRAAPRATYSPGGGSSTGRPRTAGARARTAADQVAPPT